jgi:transposase-like protein
MRGKKSDEHRDRQDPPRRRANKRRGRGTYANDRPPVLGVIGRETGQVRLRVLPNTQAETLCPLVEQFTRPEAVVFTDDYDSYNPLQRDRITVCHSTRQWARDDDGDGWFETHTNTEEGTWAGLRTFLRPFRGVHKRSLAGYVAIYEFHVNLKAISPAFIADLVRRYSF